MVGCLSNLYESVENLSDTYIQSVTVNDALLRPKVSSFGANVPLLLPSIQSPVTSNFYRCVRIIKPIGINHKPSLSYSKYPCNYIENDPKSICPTCSHVRNIPVKLVNKPDVASSSSAANVEGGCVKGLVTYMIMDDFVVSPMSAISSITLLNKFNVKEVGGLEERLSDVSTDEGVELLRASLQPRTVPSDVFLKLKAKKERS